MMSRAAQLEVALQTAPLTVLSDAELLTYGGVRIYLSTLTVTYSVCTPGLHAALHCSTRQLQWKYDNSIWTNVVHATYPQRPQSSP